MAQGDFDPGEWTVSGFAKATNISRTTLYSYFESLDGMMRALQHEMLTRVRPVEAIPGGLTPEERVKFAVDIWLKWVDDHRALVVSTLWKPAPDLTRNPTVALAKDVLIREVIAVHLGVDDPSSKLVYAVGIYIGAAQEAIRGWLVTAQASRGDCRFVLERMLSTVIAIGKRRDDVPMPLPGH